MKKIKKVFLIIIILIFLINIYYPIVVLGETNSNLRGDLDGDKKITVNDLAKIKLHLIEKEILEDKYLKLADIDGNGKVDINDMACLKLTIIGLRDPIEDISVEDTSFSGFEFKQITPENSGVNYTEYQFVNDIMLENYPGITGAGSQWPDSMEVSETGDLMLYGVDVAGLYKSLDHGKTWQKGNVRNNITWSWNDGNRS